MVNGLGRSLPGEDKGTTNSNISGSYQHPRKNIQNTSSVLTVGTI